MLHERKFSENHFCADGGGLFLKSPSELLVSNGAPKVNFPRPNQKSVSRRAHEWGVCGPTHHHWSVFCLSKHQLIFSHSHTSKWLKIMSESRLTATCIGPEPRRPKRPQTAPHVPEGSGMSLEQPGSNRCSPMAHGTAAPCRHACRAARVVELMANGCCAGL